MVNDKNGKLYHFKHWPKNNNLISDNNQKTFCSYFDFFLLSFDFGFVRAFFLLAPSFSENPILVLDYFDPSLAFSPRSMQTRDILKFIEKDSTRG